MLPDTREKCVAVAKVPTEHGRRHHHLYNPFEHRRIDKPSSDFKSFINLLKASLGSGILAMPLAFANSGWVVGLIGTMVIAFICGHCVHIFVQTSRECCKKDRVPVLGYADTCKSAFLNGPTQLKKYATAAYIFSEVAMTCTYLGVCCIFTVLIGDSLKQPVDKYILKEDLKVEYYCLIILIPLCLLVQIKHLSWLAPFSFIANVLLIVTFGICLYYIFKAPIDMSDKEPFGDLSRFPAYLSTVIFAMEGIGAVMPVENSMKTPEHFLGCPGVLVIAMSFIAVIYTALGMFGYFRYGDALRGSITLNLPITETPAICAKFFIAFSLIFTYPLHFYVAIDPMFRYLNTKIEERYHTIAGVLIRICCVLICGGIGVALPMLEQIINIVGAVFYSTLGLILPAVIQTVFYWENLGQNRWLLWKNVVLIIYGLGCLISGLIVTVIDINENRNKNA